MASTGIPVRMPYAERSEKEIAKMNKTHFDYKNNYEP